VQVEPRFKCDDIYLHSALRHRDLVLKHKAFERFHDSVSYGERTI
jgi:hypothetical protein